MGSKWLWLSFGMATAIVVTAIWAQTKKKEHPDHPAVWVIGQLIWPVRFLLVTVPIAVVIWFSKSYREELKRQLAGQPGKPVKKRERKKPDTNDEGKEKPAATTERKS